MTRSFYNEGSREIQDRFDSRRIADRLEQITLRRAFSEEDKAFITRAPMFFLATADAEGHPDCSYKGGVPGFVRVVDGVTLAFPSYDGNGQFRSLGNLTVNPHVGMLFIDFEATRRIRVNGVASIDHQDALLATYPGADMVVRVHAEEIFPNCPRYVHKMQMTEFSVYAPRSNYEPPAPAWKQMGAFRDYLPSDPAKR